MRGGLSVGLLFYKSSVIDGAPCTDVITTDLEKLRELQRQVEIGKFYDQPINDITCRSKPNESLCNGGFLEYRLGTSKGQFKHIQRKRLQENASNRKVYRQTCYLQGFFLINRGFFSSRCSLHRQKLGINERCWEEPSDPEPTTQEVLTALNTLISGLQ